MKIIIVGTAKELRNVFPLDILQFVKARTESRQLIKSFRKAVRDCVIDLSYKPRTKPKLLSNDEAANKTEVTP